MFGGGGVALYFYFFFLKYILLLQLRPISLRYILRCLKPLDFLITETYKCTLWRCFQKRVVRTKLDIYVFITYWCLLCGRICVYCEEFEDTKGWGGSESENRRKDNTMAKRKRTNNYMCICKTYHKIKDNRCLHRKLCSIIDKMSSELECVVSHCSIIIHISCCNKIDTILIWLSMTPIYNLIVLLSW